ncbi:MAG: lipopolysaccharide biosynthesis protein [Actinobacteria bacterium]|nr:lipopolysaccharide biosynthesis protein [Actinomycetota bacterium]
MTTERSAAGRPTGGEEGRAARSFFWAALSFGGNRVLLFLATLVLARLLVPADFGLVAAGMTLILYLEVGLDLGVGSALIFEQEHGITPRVQTAFTLNMVVSAALTVAGVAAAPAVAAFFHAPGQQAVFRVLFCYLVVRGAGQVHDAVLKRDLHFRRRTAVDLLRAAVRAGVSIALALSGLGVWAIVWGLLAGEAAGTALSWRLVRFRPSLRLDRTAGTTLLRFGLSVTALKMLNEVGMNADYLVVGNRLGTSALGYYAIAYRLPELLIDNVYWVFSSIAFPVYARARTLGPEAFRAAMLRALRLTTLFGFTCGVGLALVARDAVLVLFSARWQPSVGAMTFISLALALGSVGYASGDIFPAVGQPGRLLRINAPLVVALIVAFVLAAPYGITTVAGVHLGFEVMYGGLRMVVANRLVGSTMRESLAAMRPALCAVAGMLLLALPVRLAAPPGLPALLAVVAAGATGAVTGVLLGARTVVPELRRTALRAVGR